MTENDKKVIPVNFGDAAKRREDAKFRGTLGPENIRRAEDARRLHIEGRKSAEVVHRLSGFLAQNSTQLRNAVKQLRSEGIVMRLLFMGWIVPELQGDDSIWGKLARLLVGSGPADFIPLTNTLVAWFESNIPNTPAPKVIIQSGIVEIF